MDMKDINELVSGLFAGNSVEASAEIAPAEKPAEVPAEKPAEVLAEKPAEKPAEVLAEKPAEADLSLDQVREQFLRKKGYGWMYDIEKIPENLIKGANAGVFNTVKGLADLTLEALKVSAQAFVSEATDIKNIQRSLSNVKLPPTESEGALANVTTAVGKFAAGFIGASGLVSKLQYAKSAPTFLQSMTKGAIAHYFAFDC